MSGLALLRCATIAGCAGLVTGVFAQSVSHDTRQRARNGDFDSRAMLPCAQERGQSLGTCTMDVARSGRDATVVVTFRNGFSRRLYFVQGAFVSANATMSGVGTDTDWRVEQGTHYIRVDDQRYELPEAFVFGQ